MTYTDPSKAITIRSFTRGDYVAFDVIDEGSGIPDDELPHIFEGFYRGQQAMQDDSTSSGLGLTIVRMVVERYQRTVFATSPATGGAHIQIILPYYQEDRFAPPVMPSQILIPVDAPK